MKSKLTIKTNIPQMQKNLEEIGNTGLQFTLGELLNPSFLSECSSFTSLEDMLEKSGFKAKTKEDFAAIPDDEWDRFITENTTYDNWKDMQVAAVNKLAAKQFHERLTKDFKKL